MNPCGGRRCAFPPYPRYAQTIIDTGEELVFTMDVPYVPVQDTPVVLAQAATPGAGSTIQQPDFILKECQETESTGDPKSAMRGVDPAYALKNFLQNRDKHYIDLAAIKTTLLEGTTRGKIFAEVDNMGFTAYHYDPAPNYVGKDRAVFMAEFEGKRYKIVVDLVVSTFVDEKAPVCPKSQLIKVSKPTSGSSGYDLNSILVSFAALDGGAVGQTTGTTITLDSNASQSTRMAENVRVDCLRLMSENVSCLTSIFCKSRIR